MRKGATVPGLLRGLILLLLCGHGHSVSGGNAAFEGGGLSGGYPNPAAVNLAYQIISQKNQFLIDELRLTGIVQNLGGAPFAFRGKASIYRGAELIASREFADLAPGGSFRIEVTLRESYDYTWEGATITADYLLQIDYPSGITARREEIDSNFSNNRFRLPGAVIAADAYRGYAQGYRLEMLELINSYRRSRGRTALVLDECISVASQAHSEWMKLNAAMSHNGRRGSRPLDRCRKAGCSCTAENLYHGSMFPRDALNAWIRSPGHNTTLLGNFTRIGIGICGGWITADFD